MFKDCRHINAGTNEVYRWGHAAVEAAESCLVPNENGFYSIPADGGRCWTIGTSQGKYGEYAKVGDKFLSVNKGGYVWAKVGTEKEEVFKTLVNGMIEFMNQLREEQSRNRSRRLKEEYGEDEEE